MNGAEVCRAAMTNAQVESCFSGAMPAAKKRKRDNENTSSAKNPVAAAQKKCRVPQTNRKTAHVFVHWPEKCVQVPRLHKKQQTRQQTRQRKRLKTRQRQQCEPFKPFVGIPCTTMVARPHTCVGCSSQTSAHTAVVCRVENTCMVLCSSCVGSSNADANAPQKPPAGRHG